MTRVCSWESNAAPSRMQRVRILPSLLRNGLEVVPAGPHEPFDAGSIPASATVPVPVNGTEAVPCNGVLV